MIISLSLNMRFRLASFLGLVASLLAVPLQAQIFADFQTSLGGFTVELFHQDVPRTVANFVGLVDGTRPWVDPRTTKVQVGVPFYDGIIFHRVIPDFMIQGGSPAGTGTDGPGYKVPDELTKGPNGQLLHSHNAAGMVSMANSGIHTNGSQFFITTSVKPPLSFPTHLDDKHTVFGRLVDGPAGAVGQGQAVVDAISVTPANASNKPLTPVVMQSVRIRRVGAAAEAFNAAAWSLPDVTGATTINSTRYAPGNTPPSTTRFEITYTRSRHAAASFSYSLEGEDWVPLTVGGASSTAIATATATDPLNITGVGGLPQLLLRGRSIDYAPLIEHTLPTLTDAAVVRLKFSNPAGIEVLVRRTGPSVGTWSRSGSPEITGAATPLSYGAGTGDVGLFSPVLTMGFPLDRLPWTAAASLSSLNVTLTFDADSMTTGYFRSTGLTVPVPPSLTGATVSGSGVFTVEAP